MWVNGVTAQRLWGRTQSAAATTICFLVSPVAAACCTDARERMTSSVVYARRNRRNERPSRACSSPSLRAASFEDLLHRGALYHKSIDFPSLAVQERYSTGPLRAAIHAEHTITSRSRARRSAGSYPSRSWAAPAGRLSTGGTYKMRAATRHGREAPPRARQMG